MKGIRVDTEIQATQKALTVLETGLYNEYLAPPPYVERDSVRRCQHGSCTYQTISAELKYCIYHNPYHNGQPKITTRHKRYNFIKAFARVAELSVDPEFKCLREEVSVLRILLETLVNQTVTPWDAQVNAPRLESLVEKISKTVTTCHKIETHTGQMLDKQSLSTFADKVISIIANHVKDSELLILIGKDIASAITSTASEVPFRDGEPDA